MVSFVKIMLIDMLGNIPALVRFLQGFLIRGAKEIVANNQLLSFLGIYQKLTSSRINDHFGLELLGLIFQHVPMYLKQYLVFNF